jgi:hypothetical protein
MARIEDPYPHPSCGCFASGAFEIGRGETPCPRLETSRTNREGREAAIDDACRGACLGARRCQPARCFGLNAIPLLDVSEIRCLLFSIRACDPEEDAATPDNGDFMA